MKRTDREERALTQLLKIARFRADDLQGHLATLESAKVSAERSIGALAEAVASEERASQTGGAALIDFGRFLNGAQEKRRTLEATRGTLAAQISSIRTDLHDAFAEIKKLEHLAETGRRAAAIEAQQQAAAAAAELAAMRKRG